MPKMKTNSAASKRAKITGTGKYTGSLSKTFQITALTASYVTTAKINYRSGAGTKYRSSTSTKYRSGAGTKPRSGT